jgi:hypothetical protein
MPGNRANRLEIVNCIGNRYLENISGQDFTFQSSTFLATVRCVIPKQETAKQLDQASSTCRCGFQEFLLGRAA